MYICFIDEGFHKWDTPIWMVYFMEHPSYKWMRTGGTPTSGNPHIHNIPVV